MAGEEVKLGGIELLVKMDQASFKAPKVGKGGGVDAAGRFGGQTRIGPPPGRKGDGGALLKGGAGAGGFLAGAAIAGGIVIAGAVAGLALLTVASKKLTKHFLTQGRELRHLNISLARAAAHERISELMRGLDRAAAIGPIFERLSHIVENLKNKAAPFVNFLLVQTGRALETFFGLLDTASSILLIFVDRILASADAYIFLIQSMASAMGALGKWGPWGFLFKFTGDIRKDLAELRKQLQELNDHGADTSEFNLNFLNAIGELAGGIPGRDVISPNVFPPGVHP